MAPTLSLEILGVDILHQVCSLLSERKLYSHDQIYKREFLDSLLALSATSRSLREVCLPFLFHEAIIHQERVYPRPDPWIYADLRLESLNKMRMANISHFVKIFDFTVYQGRVEKTDRMPANTAAQLVSTLSRMPNLQDFSLNVPKAHRFAKAIKTAGLTFPKVQKLLLGPQGQFLIPLCPNVRIVQTSSEFVNPSGWSGDYEYDAAIETLKVLLDSEFASDFSFESWSVGMIDVLKIKPEKVRAIGVLSDLDYVPHLSSFSNLESLKLGSLTSLDRRYCPPKCGNSYMGPRGAETRRRVYWSRIGAEKKVIESIEATFGEGSKLRKLDVDREIWERTTENADQVEEEKAVFRIGNWTRARNYRDDRHGEVRM